MMIRTQKPEESSWISLSNIDQFKKKAFALYGWHVIGLQFRWYPTVKRWRINSQTNRITFNKKVQNKNNGRERKWSIGNGRKAAPNANRNRKMRDHIDTSFSYSRVFNISLKFYSMNEHCTVYILYSCGWLRLPQFIQLASLRHSDESNRVTLQQK